MSGLVAKGPLAITEALVLLLAAGCAVVFAVWFGAVAARIVNTSTPPQRPYRGWAWTVPGFGPAALCCAASLFAFVQLANILLRLLR